MSEESSTFDVPVSVINTSQQFFSFIWPFNRTKEESSLILPETMERKGGFLLKNIYNFVSYSTTCQDSKQWFDSVTINMQKKHWIYGQ